MIDLRRDFFKFVQEVYFAGCRSSEIMLRRDSSFRTLNIKQNNQNKKIASVTGRYISTLRPLNPLCT